MDETETTETTTDETPETAEAPDTSGAHVEAVGSGDIVSVWECSEGDFHSRINAGEVEAHIAAVHSEAVAKLHDLKGKGKTKR